jgi:hypothetical protein
MSPPKGRSDVLLQEVADGCVLFDPLVEKAFVFNATAALIWSLLDGAHGTDDIVKELAESLAADAPPREQLERDVERAIEEFRGHGLLA